MSKQHVDHMKKVAKWGVQFTSPLPRSPEADRRIAPNEGRNSYISYFGEGTTDRIEGTAVPPDESFSPRYPDANFPLLKIAGDSKEVLKRAVRKLRRAGATAKEIEEFVKEASSGDYIKLVNTIKIWMTVTS